MKDRYSRNIGSISAEEQARLYGKTALVVGMGGLGGYAAMFLSRMGVGNIRFCDFDVFDETNINRQLFCSENSLGLHKTDVALRHLKYMNSAPNYTAFNEKLDDTTAEKMIVGCNVVIDALDNVESRIVLEKLCSRYKVPLVFGAVSGWTGTVSTIMPGKPKLGDYYKNYRKTGVPSVLPFSAAAISSFQTAEAVKVMLGKPSLVDRLLLVDLQDNQTKILPF